MALQGGLWLIQCPVWHSLLHYFNNLQPEHFLRLVLFLELLQFAQKSMWCCTEVYGAIFRLTPPCCSWCCCIRYLAFLGPTPSCHTARREFATMGARQKSMSYLKLPSPQPMSCESHVTNVCVIFIYLDWIQYVPKIISRISITPPSHIWAWDETADTFEYKYCPGAIVSLELPL